MYGDVIIIYIIICFSLHAYFILFVYIMCIFLCEYFISASILSIFLNPSGLDQNTVGYRQNLICSVSVPPDVDPDTIELRWLNEDDIITDDSRVTIDTSSDYFNDSTLVSIIQFDPLIEEDEGEYICYAVINESFVFEYTYLQNFKSKYMYMLKCYCT